MTVLLTRKAVLQVAMETTYNTPASVGSNDGALVSNPLFTVKPNVLERNFVHADLSQNPHIIGRIIAGVDFETELRGNGIQNSGIAGNAPIIARMFRACGYKMTACPSPVIKGPFDIGDPPIEVGWALASEVTAGNVFTEDSTDNFLAGDTFEVGNVTYTFVATGDASAPNDVSIGANFSASANNLVAAIMGTGTPGVSTYGVGTTAQTQASASHATTIVFTALVGGVSGNSIPCVYTPTSTAAGALAGGHTTLLYGGVDAATNTDAIAYYMKVTTPGASGTAKITVTSDTAGEGDAEATVTAATPFSLGTKGLTITPTWTGNLTDGMQWVVWLMPSGISLDPRSDNFESITLALHKDGVLHTMPGAYGTFDITAQAGNFAMVKWTFTGTYQAPVDDPNPSPVFERTLPSEVELARLNVNQFQAVVEKFTFNQGNDIQVRPDVSASNGYVGVLITNRKPVGGIDPEADTVANQNFWDNLATALRMPFQMRVGHLPGNTIWVMAPNTQYTGMTYGDRNGIMKYDAGLSFSRIVGNDEVSFYLM